MENNSNNKKKFMEKSNNYLLISCICLVDFVKQDNFQSMLHGHGYEHRIRARIGVSNTEIFEKCGTGTPP